MISFTTASLLVAMLLGSAWGQEKRLPLPGEVFTLGKRTAFVIPPSPDQGKRGVIPWVWYAPTLKGLPSRAEEWMFRRLLAKGIAIAGVDVGESYGSPRGRAGYQALYEEMTTRRGYSNKPVLLARSRGGLMLYNWAVEHPACVGGIAGIYPVCDLTSYPGLERAARAYEMTPKQLRDKLSRHNPLHRLAPLAKARVPIFHIHGDKDRVVPLSANSGALRKRYEALKGPIRVAVIKGQGHNMWSGWFQSQELTDFMVRRALNEGAGSPRKKQRD